MVSGSPPVRPADGQSLFEETVPDGMGTGEQPDEPGVSGMQLVLGTEHEPHLLAALLHLDRSGGGISLIVHKGF
jgi:hypothetical protein